MNWRGIVRLAEQIVVIIFSAIFILSLLIFLLSFSHWSQNSVALTMLGEYLFLQESGVSKTFFALEILQISAAILLFSQVSQRRWLRFVLGISMLLYPSAMLILLLARTTPGA